MKVVLWLLAAAAIAVVSVVGILVIWVFAAGEDRPTNGDPNLHDDGGGR
jgi:hypothetical protein